MEITLDQLEALLSRQRYLCLEKFKETWNESAIRKEIIEIEQSDKIANKIHWVWDSILAADVPNDIKILKQYNVT